MSIVKKVFKPCPGPLHNGENLPLDKFSKSSVTVDGRSKICIECQKKELEEMPKKEKKTRGCPPGGWPKKEKPNIADWMEGKIDHPSKPLPEISKKEPELMPESSPSKNTPLKFDLSKFKKITFDRRVLGEPMIRIGKKNEISFNVCASNEYKLMECKSFDVYMDKTTGKTAIVFIPRNDTDGTFKAQHQPSYCYFNSIKLVRELSVPAGRYPVSRVDGALVVEVSHE